MSHVVHLNNKVGDIDLSLHAPLNEREGGGGRENDGEKDGKRGRNYVGDCRIIDLANLMCSFVREKR